MTKKPKLLQICRRALPNSFFDYYGLLDNALSKVGYDVTTVFLNNRLSPKRELQYQGKIVYLDNEKKTMFKQNWVTVLRLLPLFLKHKFKIIVCHKYKPMYVGAFLRKIFRTPKTFCFLHDMGLFHKKKRQAFIRKHLINACTMVNVSRTVEEELLHLCPNCKKDKSIVIYNAIDDIGLEQHIVDSLEARKRFTLKSNSFVLGTVGRLVKWKAHNELIDSFAKIHIQAPNAELVIIGGGENAQDLQEQIENLNLAHKIKLVGAVEDAAKYMSAFNVFVLSSHSEAFGLVLPEAMINHLPVISYDNGGPFEILPNKDFLVKTGDIDALANKMLEMYHTNPEELAHIGKKNFKHAKKYFSTEAYIKKIGEIFVIDS